MSKRPDISIIIVNYNVKEYLSNLLHSIEKAKDRLNIEIFVVDNASLDGSKELIPSKFPYIKYIYNQENLGFGKANNQAIKLANGKYTLLINPDTLVSEDTLIKMYEHMEAKSEVAASGCKILNSDGSFAPESRRSIPTIRSAASKVLGLSSIFPKSKVFAGYYLGWLDENEQAYIPVLSGSFMFFRTGVLKELNGFDERFFMYGEDIDLCYRVTNFGYKISYYPETSIIHYKGESTKKGDLKYVKLFNKANYQFFQKHFTSRYSWLFKSLIYLAISFRGLTSFILTKSKKARLAFFDILILNISLIAAYVIRFSFTQELDEKLNSLQSLEFLWVNVLLSGLYVIFAIGFVSDRREESISESLRNNFLSFVGVVSLTFFIRELAFSRIVLAISFLFSSILLSALRLYRINQTKQLKGGSGKFKKTRLVIVGGEKATQNLMSKINVRTDWHYEVVGVVSSSATEPTGKTLGSINQLNEIVKSYSIDQVFFIQTEVSYKAMLEQISNLRKEELIFKIVPESMNYILGKSNIEYIDSVPVVLFNLPYQQTINKIIKRFFDIALALPLTILFWIISIPNRAFQRNEKNEEGDLIYYTPLKNAKIANCFQLFKSILVGSFSFVGSPIFSEFDPVYRYKKGVMGLAQLNDQRINSAEDQERFELNYLQNYSIWMDIDILMKSFFSDFSILKNLEKKETKK